MRAILIDPSNKTITEVEHQGDFRNIQRLIEADCFDCVRLGTGDEDTIFVDDCGLLNGKAQEVGMFRVEGNNPAYLAGKALILATDREGDSVGTDLTLEHMQTIIAFGEPANLNGVLMFVEGGATIANILQGARKWRIEG